MDLWKLGSNAWEKKISFAGNLTVKDKNILLRSSVNRFGIICQNRLQLSTRPSIKMLSLPKLILSNCLPNWRHDMIPLIMQLCKHIRLQPELPNDHEFSLDIPTKSQLSHLLQLSWANHLCFCRPLDELFDAVLKKAKDHFPDLGVFEIVWGLLSREKNF